LRILGQYPGLLVLLGVIALLGTCGWPFLSLLPALAHSLAPGDHALYGWLVSASGAGALSCALLVTQADTGARRRRLTVAGVLGIPVALLALSAAKTTGAALLAAAVAGGSIVMFFSTSQSIIQLRVADSEQGRVMATLMATLGGSILVGNLILGPAADHFGLPVALRGVAGLAALGALIIVTWRPQQ
ncbi:MAG: MFS transporter, partial [Candidatus Eremiobacterota bacterium]